MGINQTLSDKLENASYYVLRTLFSLHESISYEQILLQYILDPSSDICVQRLSQLFKQYV